MSEKIRCFLLTKTEKTQTFEIEHDKGVTKVTSPVYRREDTGEEMIPRDAPVGAIWRADWYEDFGPSHVGVDGRSYVVKTPAGDWAIDSRASNCTMKDDEIHKCWCRHGDPPDFTVNKNGNTCEAGAGSILIDRGEKHYHGFLTNGWLEPC